METQEEYKVRVQPHWSETADRQTFVQAVADLGLDGQSVPAILGVSRVGEFAGTAQEAIDALLDYAARNRQDLRDTLLPQQPIHGEAQAIAFTEVYTADGTKINVTARQGAAPDDIVATVLALTDALDILKQFGMRPTKTPPRVVPPVQVRDAPGPSEFWAAAKRYTGPGKPFENKDFACKWLNQFSTGNGFDWTAAIKALYSFDVNHTDEFSVVGLQPLDGFSE